MEESCTYCVPGADINIRTKIRTVGGITVRLYVLRIFCVKHVVYSLCRYNRNHVFFFFFFFFFFFNIQEFKFL
jgi:hypothetical protein